LSEIFGKATWITNNSHPGLISRSSDWKLTFPKQPGLEIRIKKRMIVKIAQVRIVMIIPMEPDAIKFYKQKEFDLENSMKRGCHENFDFVRLKIALKISTQGYRLNN
jgi:hypothetical protein